MIRVIIKKLAKLHKYLASENDDPNRAIIPGISESTHKLLHRVGAERIPSLWPINTYLHHHNTVH